MVLARIARSRGLRLRSLLQPRAWSQNWAFSRAKGRAVQPYAPSSGPWSQRGVCGSGALRGAVVGGVAGLGDRRRFGGLAEVTQNTADLSLVAQHGHEAQAAVALGAVEHVDVVAPAEQVGPGRGGPGHQQYAIEESAEVFVGEDER